MSPNLKKLLSVFFPKQKQLVAFLELYVMGTFLFVSNMYMRHYIYLVFGNV